MRRYLDRNIILKNVAHKDKGFFRWDFGDSICLFLTDHDDWYDGPLVWKGWTIHLIFSDGFVPMKISPDDAWNLLIENFGKWQEMEDPIPYEDFRSHIDSTLGGLLNKTRD